MFQLGLILNALQWYDTMRTEKNEDELGEHILGVKEHSRHAKYNQLIKNLEEKFQ